MKNIYFGQLLPREYQYKFTDFVGLSLYPSHERELRHNLYDPLPCANGSVEKIQAQDVLEHLKLEKVSSVFNDIYRVLMPGGIFRLSVPDYRSPLLSARSVYDREGRVIGDTMMGATVYCDSGRANVKFDGGAHLWFPTYEIVNELILNSDLRRCNKIEFWHYFHFDGSFVVREFPHLDMPVTRCPPIDNRASGKPISIIVDFIK